MVRTIQAHTHTQSDLPKYTPHTPPPKRLLEKLVISSELAVCELDSLHLYAYTYFDRNDQKIFQLYK